jgi:PKD repeat protein
VFNATVHWGDGVITNVSNIVDGQTITHTYDAAGIYTVHITGSGTRTSPEETCTFNPNTIVTVQTHVQTRGIAVHIPRVA